jgi:hypothetical protein
MAKKQHKKKMMEINNNTEFNVFPSPRKYSQSTKRNTMPNSRKVSLNGHLHEFQNYTKNLQNAFNVTQTINQKTEESTITSPEEQQESHRMK